MFVRIALFAACAVAAGLAASRGEDAHAAAATTPAFSKPTTIDNPYLPLTKFRRCVLRGEAGDGTKERSVKTVQSRTKRFEVGGRPVNAVVIKDNAYEGGELVETTLTTSPRPTMARSTTSART